MLSFYAAGLQIASALGKTWRIAPSLGGLTSVDVRFKTKLGSFASNVAAVKEGLNASFATPKGTMGVVSLDHPAKDVALTIPDIGRGAEDPAVTLTGGSSGKVEIDGLLGREI